MRDETEYSVTLTLRTCNKNEEEPHSLWVRGLLQEELPDLLYGNGVRLIRNSVRVHKVNKKSNKKKK